MQCPSEYDLRKLIDGGATPEEQSALAEHLDACADCRTALDRLTAGRESWVDVRRQLADSPEPASPALADAMNKLEADAGSAETSAEPKRAAERKLDFLDPPEVPGHLGRLGHYEVLEVVGQGGMGIVLRAQDTKLQRIVAIKVMLPELAARAEARRRFIREARAAAAVTHEHVVTIHEVQEDHAPPYLVMQYVAGRSLQDRLDACGALELKEILRIGMQAASGLAAAHAQGLVHRDIKPANILLENGIERVKITDFGLARAADDARLTQSGVVTGTPQYMSPEQAGGKGVDHRADLFSLGGVMYAMCTGYAPFRASTSMAVLKKVCDESPRPIRELNPELPDWIAGIVEKLMAKEPKQRFQSAADLASLLGQHLAHLQQPAVFPQPAEVARPLAARPSDPAGRSSLALPILLLVAPFVLVPVLMFANQFIGQGNPLAGVGGAIAVVTVCGLCFLVGLILLIVRLAARGIPAWIAVVVVGAACLVLLPCLIVPLGLGWFVLSSSTSQDMQRSAGGQTSVGSTSPPRAPVSGPGLDRGPDVPSRVRVVEGLSWFPADATLFGVIDFTPFGSLTINNPLVQAVLEKLVPPGERGLFAADNFADARLDRVSFAMVERPQKPAETRYYIRLSGKINRTRMTRALLEQYPAATARQGSSVPEDRMTFVTIPGVAPLIAIDRDEEVIIVGYEAEPADKSKRQQLMSEVIRFSVDPNGVDWSNPNLTRGSYLDALNKLPEDTFALLMGDVPVSLHQELSAAKGGPFRAVPRFLSVTARRDTRALYFEGLLPGPKEATAFAADLGKQLTEGALAVNKLAPEGQRDALAQLISAAKPAAEANKVTVRMSLPDDLTHALADAMRALPPMYTLGATTAVVPVNLLKRFDPKADKPAQSEAGGKRVTVEQDAWRIDSQGGAPGDKPADLRLFEIPFQATPNSLVALRFKMKAQKPGLSVGVRPKLEPSDAIHDFEDQMGKMLDAVRGTTEWQSFEIRRGYKDRQPSKIAILVDANAGTFWLKDVELVRLPDAAPLIISRPKTNERAESLLMRFDPKAEKPITKEALGFKVSEEQGGWRVQHETKGEAQPFISAADSIPLFELPRPPVRGRRVTLRCQVKTEGKDQVSEACLELEPGDVTKRGLGPVKKGSTNWAPYEVSIDCMPNAETPTLRINARIVWNGSLWVKDVELVATPLTDPEPVPPPDPAAAPKSAPPNLEVILKRFSPMGDKPITTEVRGITIKPGELDEWKVFNLNTLASESDGPRVRLFDLKRPDVLGQQVTVRCKVRSDKVEWARVYLRKGEEPSVFDTKGRKIEGTTNWADYEFSFSFGLNLDLPERLGVDVALSPGSLWIKDLEVVKSPLPEWLELQKLQGTWVGAADGEMDGKIVAYPAEAAKWRIVFDKEKCKIEQAGRVVQAPVWRMGLDRPPDRYLSLALQEFPGGGVKTQELLYHLDGDTLRVCGAAPGKGFDSFEFSAKQGTGRWVMTFKRLSAAAADETRLKEFVPGRDQPISTELRGRKLTVEQDAWKIESNDDDDLGSEANIPRFHLFEVRGPAGVPGRVVWRFKVKTENSEQRSFFEVHLHRPDAFITDALVKSRPIEGSTNWTTHEISWDPDKLPSDAAALDLVVRNRRQSKSTVWIKDVELVKLPTAAPRPEPTKTAPAKETLLKKFDPKTDKPSQTELNDRVVTVEQGAWRIEAKKPAPPAPPFGWVAGPEVRVFHLPKQPIQHGTIVLRFTLKSEKVTDRATVSLNIGATSVDWLGNNSAPIRGTMDWTRFELRRSFNGNEPADVSASVGILETGTIWLKDVELVKINSGP
jgi:uncharacterized protein (TIGR03067 family)